MRPRVAFDGSFILLYAAGWLALLVWIPAIRSSMAAGKPHGWIAMPTVTDLRTAYLFADSLSWLRLFKRHSLEVGFQIVSRTAEFLIYVPLAVVFLLRPYEKSCGQDGEPSLIQEGALLLVAFILLSTPAVLVSPLPSHHTGLRSAIFSAERHRFGDCPGGGRGCARLRQTQPFFWRLRHVMWVAIVLFLMISPVITVLAVGPINLSWVIWTFSAWNKTSLPTVLSSPAWEEDFVKANAPLAQSGSSLLLLAGLAYSSIGTKSICARLPSDASVSE